MKSFQKHIAKERHFGRKRNDAAAETMFFNERGLVGFAERACIKKRHRTYKKAMRHVHLLVDSGEAKRGDLTVYICGDCHFYHVGHKL